MAKIKTVQSLMAQGAIFQISSKRTSKGYAIIRLTLGSDTIEFVGDSAITAENLKTAELSIKDDNYWCALPSDDFTTVE